MSGLPISAERCISNEPTLWPVAPFGVLLPKHATGVWVNLTWVVTGRVWIYHAAIVLLQVHVLAAPTAEAVVVLDVSHLYPGAAVVAGNQSLPTVLPVIAGALL